MTWIKWSALILLVSCNITSQKNVDNEESLDQKIVGFWFPCERFDDPSINPNCDLVDDDALAFTADKKVFRIDGALSYARVTQKDTSKGSYFNINIDTLYFFDEPEVLNGSYSVTSDSILVDAFSEEMAEEVRWAIPTAAISENKISGGGSIFMRKYLGKAHLINKADWIQMVTQGL